MSIKKTEKTKAGVQNFPIEVFPEKLQSVLVEVNQAKGIPLDFFAATMLSVFSTVIGNAYHVEDLNGYRQIISLYLCIVGLSSIGKSPAFKWCMRPLYQLEKLFQQEFEEADDQENAIRKDILINDATVESINFLLSRTPKGLLLYKDEMVGWLNSMVRYSNASDVNYYLEVWSGNFAKTTRIGRSTNYVHSPCLGIIGGTQPKLLNHFAKGDNLHNGLIQRMLFVFPDNQKKSKRSTKGMNPDLKDIYDEWVNRVYDLAHNFKGVDDIQIIKLSHEADKVWGDWYDKNVDEMNNVEDESHPIVSCLGKLEQYCLRFSLILEVIHQCEDKFAEISEVSVESMQRAVKLVEYFKSMLYKVFEKLENPLVSYSKKDIAFLNALEDDFDIAKGLEVADKVGITTSDKASTLRRCFFRKMKQFTNDNVIEKVSNGNYRKLI